MRIPVLYMRGGTSKGVFFNAADLPADKDARDALLLRIIDSPAPIKSRSMGCWVVQAVFRNAA